MSLQLSSFVLCVTGENEVEIFDRLVAAKARLQIDPFLARGFSRVPNEAHCSSGKTTVLHIASKCASGPNARGFPAESG
jgi:hypothetical protein